MFLSSQKALLNDLNDQQGRVPQQAKTLRQPATVFYMGPPYAIYWPKMIGKPPLVCNDINLSIRYNLWFYWPKTNSFWRESTPESRCFKGSQEPTGVFSSMRLHNSPHRGVQSQFQPIWACYLFFLAATWHTKRYYFWDTISLKDPSWPCRDRKGYDS